MTSISN